jgi:hypothetical protein
LRQGSGQKFQNELREGGRALIWQKMRPLLIKNDARELGGHQGRAFFCQSGWQQNIMPGWHQKRGASQALKCCARISAREAKY